MEMLAKDLASLGMSKRTIQVYLYVLRNKRVRLKEVAQYLEISVPGAFKILKEMAEQGLIKTLEVKNKKIYMPSDIRELRKRFISDLAQRESNIEKVFDQLESGYGEYTVKVYRFGTEYFIPKIREMVAEAKEVFEFFDLRNVFNVKKKKPTAHEKLYTLYCGEDGAIPWGINVDCVEGKMYANIVAFDDKVSFTTTNKENIVIENSEIFNTIALLMKKDFK